MAIRTESAFTFSQTTNTDCGGNIYVAYFPNCTSARLERSGLVDFFNVLAGPELLAKTEEHLPEHRKRLYPPTVVLATLIKQA